MIDRVGIAVVSAEGKRRKPSKKLNHRAEAENDGILEY